MINKILDTISKANFINKSFAPGYAYRASVNTYEIGRLTLQAYNGLFKAYWDGAEIGMIRESEEYERVLLAIFTRQKELKNDSLKQFLES